MYSGSNMAALLDLVSPFLDWLEEQDEESEEEEPDQETPTPSEELKTPKPVGKTEAQLRQEELIAKQLAAQQEVADKLKREVEEKERAELAAKSAEPRLDLLANQEEEEDDEIDLDNI